MKYILIICLFLALNSLNAQRLDTHADFDSLQLDSCLRGLRVCGGDPYNCQLLLKGLDGANLASIQSGSDMMGYEKEVIRVINNLNERIKALELRLDNAGIK